MSAQNATIGSLLRPLRKNRRLTMEQAAERAGLHRATLQRWETGQVEPRLMELESLLTVLDASPEQRHQALALLNAPRAQTRMRQDQAQEAEQRGLGAMPQGGDLLRAMRWRRGWSQEKIALRLGVTTSTLCRWEKTETWPSTEQLHRLCRLLEAHSEESLALTQGRFARSFLPRNMSTAKELAERVEQSFHTYREPPFVLKDLELLALQAEAWMLASRNAANLPLMIDVQALTCYFFSYHDRDREAIAAADRYFELVPRMPQDRREQSVWLNIRHGAVTNRLRTGTTTPKRSLEELCRLHPLSAGTHHESGTLVKISEVLMLQGAVEAGLQVAADAFQVAQRTQGDAAAIWVQGAQGMQLIRCGRHAEGLPLLSDGIPGDRYRQVDTSLWRAEALLGLDERRDAERWLAQAQADLTRYEMQPLQSRLNTLQAQLAGEPAPSVSKSV